MNMTFPPARPTGNDVIADEVELLLLEYASGALDEALSLLVAAYVTLSPQARQTLAHCEALGGALIESGCAPVAMNRDSLAAVMARIETGTATPPQSTAAAIRTDYIKGKHLPLPLCRHLSTCGEKARWRRLPGMKMMNIPTRSADYQLMLLQIAPGGKTSHHSHHGQEITLVLDGAFTDARATYRTGELALCGSETAHAPVACPEQGCICIVALNSPLAFSNPVIRLLNRLLGPPRPQRS